MECIVESVARATILALDDRELLYRRLLPAMDSRVN
jgi:hypothetical protein